MYSFNLSHSPSYHLIPIFFSLLARKLNNALWKITHNGKNYILPLSQAQVSYFISHGDILWIILLILKIYVFCTLQDTCGGPDTELKLDIMKLTRYIIQRTIYLCISDTSKYIIWNQRNISWLCARWAAGQAARHWERNFVLLEIVLATAEFLLARRLMKKQSVGSRLQVTQFNKVYS